jgi:hypothetical protein
MNHYDEVRVNALINKNYEAIKKHPGNLQELTRIHSLLDAANDKDTQRDREDITHFKRLNKLAYNHLCQSMTDADVRNWNSRSKYIKIKSKSPVVFVFDNSPQEYTIEDFYTKYFKYMAKSVSRYTKRSADKVYLTMPSHFNILQRTQIKDCVERAGLECVKILPVSSMKILSTERDNKEAGKHFMIDMNSSMYTFFFQVTLHLNVFFFTN